MATAASSHDNTAEPAFDTFIFDLDGTLLDTLPDLVLLTNAVLREEGFPERTEAEILSYVGNGVKALMHQAVPEDADEAAVEDAMRRWKELYPQYGNELTRLYPGIPEVLAALAERGVALGALSNKFEAGVLQVLDEFLPGRFAVRHGEAPGIPRKPDPSGLLRTIGELGSAAARTVYVGDSPGDVATSRNAGVFSIGVSWGYHDREHLVAAGADAVIDHPSELLRFAPAAPAAG